VQCANHLTEKEVAMRIVLTLLTLSLLAGCGGGAGTGGSVVAPGKVSVEVTALAGSSATVVYAVDLTLQLPPGVTVSAGPQGDVLQQALHAADSAALIGARFSPAGSSSPPLLQATVADPLGFTVGPLLTIDCDVAQGAALGAGNFQLTFFSAKDSNGATLPGVTASISVQPQ
jgi:hypothetical protein